MAKPQRNQDIEPASILLSNSSAVSVPLISPCAAPMPIIIVEGDGLAGNPLHDRGWSGPIALGGSISLGVFREA